jgi:hypothetical protein
MSWYFEKRGTPMNYSKKPTNNATPYVSVNTLTQSKNAGLSIYPPNVTVVQKKPGPESVSKSNLVVQPKQSGVEKDNGKDSSKKEESGVLDRVLAVGLGGTAEVIEKIPSGCFVPVPGFEFMQNFFKGMMVGSLERLSQEKAAHLWRITQNVIKAVNSAEYMKAYFWGFLRGFFGDFILIWELPGIVKSTADFIGNLIAQIKELSKEDYIVFAGRINEIKELVVESGKEYIDALMRDIRAGKVSSLIIETLQAVADFSQGTGKTVGGHVTGTMIEYFSKEYQELGKELGGLMGEASGTITFTALLAAITAGVGAAWGGVRTGIKTVTEIIGKGVNQAVKTIKTALKNLSKIFGVLIDGARAVIKGFGKGASKLFKGIKGKLDKVLVKVKRLLDDILERLGRKALDQAAIDKILSIPKGRRPEPSTYLSLDYIKSHLSEFQGGVTKIMPQAPAGTVGPMGGGFVMSKKQADELIKLSGGDIAKLEELLGFDKGYLGNTPVRIDIKSPNGLRMPSGNELGANKYWTPGGYTSGGIKEAVIDPAPKGTYTINRIK